MERWDYEQALEALQIELCALQDWVAAEGARIVVVFEGRAAAGKGRLVKTITDRVNPRVFRVAAVAAPVESETVQVYLRRCLRHGPAAGEVVIFARSWYDWAGAEYVLGRRTHAQHRRFLKVCPEFERSLVDGGIRLIKYWLEVSEPEQKRRLEARRDDPLRQWKLSAADLGARSRWFEYSRARDLMLEATDTKFAPWYIVPADDKRRARLNCIRHLLGLIPYKKVARAKMKLPARSMQDAYDDQAALKSRRFVPARY